MKLQIEVAIAMGLVALGVAIAPNSWNARLTNRAVRLALSKCRFGFLV